MDKVALSVVIVNYRTPAFITDCLTSLLPELKGTDSKVVVVDNMSGDDSCSVIQAWLDSHDDDNRVALVKADVNSGFAGGNNTGINAQQAELYLLLNSDTLVLPNAIQTLLKTTFTIPRGRPLQPTA